MFFPKAMSEIEMVVPAQDLLKVTRVLSGRGVFHQVENTFSTAGQTKGAADSWPEKAAAYAALERRIQLAMQNLGVADAPVEMAEMEETAALETSTASVERIEEDVKAATEAVSETGKEIERLKSHRSQLEPISDLDLDVGSLRPSRFLFPMLGAMPAANVSRLEKSLSRIPHLVLAMREEAQRPVVLIAGTQGNRDIVERAARSSYFEALSLPEAYDGNPRQVINWLNQEITRQEEVLEEHKARVVGLGQRHAEELRRLAWVVHASRALSEAIVRFGRLRHTYVMLGWVPTADVAKLARQVRQVSKDAIIEITPASRAGHAKHVPVALSSSWLLRPFQMLVTTYARPRYGEVDPTLLIAITFPLLFGAMFGDVGHGLLLALLGVLLSSKKIGILRSLSGLGGLLSICGLVAVVFGFLYGSIFGFEHILHAAWFQPGEDPLSILTVAIGAGVVLLSIGFLIGIFNGIVSRNWGHLLFGHSGVSAAILYWSLLGYVAAKFNLIPIPSMLLGIVAVIAGVAVLFSGILIRLVEGERPLIEGGIFTYAIQAPMELFEMVISFLSNSLSYVRVGAFAIAHVVLSSVVFLMAELVSPGHGIAYWLIVAIGNLGIVLYEGLIVGIQAMRLSYYEFFSKFFGGGGMRFEPLKLASNQDT